VIRLALIACLLAMPASAETPPSDGIASIGPMTDDDFFRLTTCGAAPGEGCIAPTSRWRSPKLTLALVPSDGPVPEGFEARLTTALNHALREINAAGSAVRIVRTEDPNADIRVMPTSMVEGDRILDVPDISAPGIMGVGYATIWRNRSDQIVRATVLISTSITDADLTSVMLEEVTQTLGPIFDIDNPWYEGVSILSQTSNATTTIAGQDAALLRWLYPPKE
jgi:hypothetical protein